MPGFHIRWCQVCMGWCHAAHSLKVWIWVYKKIKLGNLSRNLLDDMRFSLGLSALIPLIISYLLLAMYEKFSAASAALLIWDWLSLFSSANLLIAHLRDSATNFLWQQRFHLPQGKMCRLLGNIWVDMEKHRTGQYDKIIGTIHMKSEVNSKS